VNVWKNGLNRTLALIAPKTFNYLKGKDGTTLANHQLNGRPDSRDRADRARSNGAMETVSEDQGNRDRAGHYLGGRLVSPLCRKGVRYESI